MREIPRPVRVPAPIRAGYARPYHRAMTGRNRRRVRVRATRAAIVVTALSALAGCSSTGLVTGTLTSPRVAVTADALTTRTPSAADAQAADRIVRDAFQSLGGQVPALYVGIWDPQRGFFVKAYGDAVRGRTPATVNDSFRVASITKTFTATVILQLVDEGRLALDSRITAYLPASLAALPALRDITVDQLLSMRSGLPDYLNNPRGIAAEIAADPYRVWTPDELVTKATQLDVSPPGTPGYSNTSFVLLGLIAEHVTGQPLADLIAKRLTGPLGMRHTLLPPSNDTSLPAPAAHGYLNQDCVALAADAGAPGVDPSADTTDWNTSYLQGAAGMISTINDLGRWAATTLGTDLLPADLARLRLDAHSIGSDDYGLGIKRFGAWYGHDGDAFGWDTLAVHNPTTGVTFVAAANACTGLNATFFHILQNLYPDQPTG